MPAGSLARLHAAPGACWPTSARGTVWLLRAATAGHVDTHNVGVEANRLKPIEMVFRGEIDVFAC